MSFFLKYWLPVVLWMAIIFIASTDLMSAEHTSRIIGPFLHWIYPPISPLTVMRLQLAIRKAAHVSEYAVLALLLYRAFVHTVFFGRVILSGALVVLICAFYAVTDEFHQSFVPSRTASMRDVLIDGFGAAIAVCFYAALFGRKIQITNRQSPLAN